MTSHEGLNDLEYRTLERFLDGPHPALAMLRKQLPRVEVSLREPITGGSVTHFSVGEDVEPVSAPQHFQLLDVHGKLKGVRDEVGFVLFVEKGRLERLEGQLLGGSAWPEGAHLKQLYYKHPRKPGSVDLIRTPDRDYAWALGPEAGFSDRDLDATEPQPIHFATAPESPSASVQTVP